MEGVRQFFPLAGDQLEVISRIIGKFSPQVRTFLDLGCGDGFLGRFIHRLYPEASGVFVDISEGMINKAGQMSKHNNSTFVVRDFGEADWTDSIPGSKKFDLVISGYAIHHIDNPSKKRLYGDIYDLLKPGGLFLNLEHVSSPSMPLNEMFIELFLDGMSDYHESINDTKSRDEIKSMYEDPEHKLINKLESVGLQCRWLEETGYTNVDCYLKIFELALFGGTKNR